MSMTTTNAAGAPVCFSVRDYDGDKVEFTFGEDEICVEVTSSINAAALNLEEEEALYRHLERRRITRIAREEFARLESSR